MYTAVHAVDKLLTCIKADQYPVMNTTIYHTSTKLFDNNETDITAFTTLSVQLLSRNVAAFSARAKQTIRF